MAIITCPECGGKVSDKAAQCIHCGYPLADIMNSAEDKNTRYQLMLTSYDADQKISTIKHIREIKKVGLREAKDLVDNVPSVIFSDLTMEEAQSYAAKFSDSGVETEIVSTSGNTIQKSTQGIDRDVLRCPKCQSSNVVVGTRGYSLVWGFFGSGQTMNRCGKCGYKWKP